MKTLLIVESPAKAKKIQSFLGNEYIVKSSFGHIYELDTKKLNDMIKNNLTPIFKIKNQKSKLIADTLKSYNVKNVILAADDDREGDAIAWHCGNLLKVNFNENNRIIFNEISKKSIVEALENKTRLNMNSVNSQKCRQLLDLIIGYKLSPLLWKHINTKEKGLSAGRVQSCLLKILIDHENIIKTQKSEIKPVISGIFYKENIKTNKLNCSFDLNNKNIDKSEIENLFNLCIKDKNFKIENSVKTQQTDYSPSPFTTSTLQQTAYNQLGLTVNTTMSIAQKLYESGYITYMRTDSTFISKDFKLKIKQHIIDKYGTEYYKNNQNKSSKFSQEAHEAIRPTKLQKIDELSGRDKKLYELILKRTIQSHMSPAIYDIIKYLLTNNYIDIYGKFKFISKTKIFDGYLRYENNAKPFISEKAIELDNKLVYIFDSAKCEMVESNPPKYFNESSIVKQLETSGIGRPSTYSSIINTLDTRNYTVTKNIPSHEKQQDVISIIDDKIKYDTKSIKIPEEKNKVVVTYLGKSVLEYLLKYFSSIINVNFTADVEKDLDMISLGEKNWNDILKKIYNTFNPIVLDQMKIKNDIKKSNKISGYKISNGKFGPYLTDGNKNYNLNNYCKFYKKTLDDIKDKDIKIIISYPKNIGIKDREIIWECLGPYGKYIKFKNKNYKVNKNRINNIEYIKSIL